MSGSKQHNDAVAVRAAVAAAGDLPYIWELDSDRIVWLADANAVLHLPPKLDLSSGRALNDSINPEDLPGRLKALSDHFSLGRPYDCVYRLPGAGDGFRWVHDRGRADLDPDGRPVRLQGVIRQSPTFAHGPAAAPERAHQDPATGHLTADGWRGALRQAVAESDRYGRPGALLNVSVDGLLEIGEAHGPAVADALLLAVGHRLDRCVRLTDDIGRIGPDRFGIVLRDCDAPAIEVVATKIRHALANLPFATNDGSFRLSPTIAGALFPEVSRIPDQLIALAAKALGSARRAGNDGFSLLTVPVADTADAKSQRITTDRLHRALRDGHLVTVFEPVVDLLLEPAFHECLLRLQDEDGALIPASDFIPIAEATGLINHVDRRVLELAFDTLEKWPEISLSLNISARTVNDPAWLRALRARVATASDAAGRLIVEVTETVALGDLDATDRFIARLRDIGCRTGLDDFGAGFTSFRNLKALSVDFVKIDASVVRGLAEDADKRLFLRTLVGLAKGFGFQLVAEGVADLHTAERLAEEGVALFQGAYAGTATRQPGLA